MCSLFLYLYTYRHIHILLTSWRPLPSEKKFYFEIQQRPYPKYNMMGEPLKIFRQVVAEHWKWSFNIFIKFLACQLKIYQWTICLKQHSFSCQSIIMRVSIYFKSKILPNTKEHYIKESNILANNAAFNLLWKVVLPNTKEQYKKESNTLADSAAINLLQNVILQNTKGQYMRESNTLAVNAAINLLLRYILLDTRQ